MKRSIHIEAPVEKVFDFIKDPRYEQGIVAMPFTYKDVKLTKEGVGSYYSWASKTPVLRFEAFDVYTEFVPNQRITDRSSSSFVGDITYSFEPEGSGTKLTIEGRPRSFWRIPPLRELVDLFKSTASDRLLPAVKAKIEAPEPGHAAGRAAA